MHSFSPARTPKLQLSGEQLLTGEIVSHQKKIPHIPGKRSPSKTVGGMKLSLESNPIPTRTLGELTQTLCISGPGDPTETEPELCLSVSCGGTGQQWPAAGAGDLGAADLGMA